MKKGLRFDEDGSFMAQAEALRSLGKCGHRSLLPFPENASRMSSPRNVIQRAGDRAIKTIKEKIPDHTRGEGL